ncbi:hypothetical protein ANCCAN_19183 [Ancylostoma caninum]|uniref:Uncharacterized protein n=1 Tax=Ancylostoma caninum TaxID=29170 RepID=A0A368FW23_ANCCA|nr:hypothetical protein ANCCAN_19183 [Ancylostoma caninum]
MWPVSIQAAICTRAASRHTPRPPPALPPSARKRSTPVERTSDPNVDDDVYKAKKASKVSRSKIKKIQ